MKIDDLEEGVEFKERFNARPQFQFPDPAVLDVLPYACGTLASRPKETKLRSFPRTMRVLTSTNNFHCVFGRFAVRATELTVGSSRATAISVGAFFSLAAVHVFSPL